jgi:hypothetical protein
MISSVLAMLILAPQPLDAVVRSRKEYLACLTGVMQKSLKEKAEEPAFVTGLASTCAAQEQKFRAAVVAADTAVGIKRADALENADLEISDMVANIKESFKDSRGVATASK